MSDVVLERIRGWEAAGLIDAATAERLRAAEAAAAPEPEVPPPAAEPGLVSSFFGPGVSIVEMFSYLGGAFVVAAWAVLMARLVSESTDPMRQWLLVVGWAVPAAVWFVLAMVIRGRSPRLSRAAGVCLVLSVIAVGAGVTVNARIFMPDTPALAAGAIAGLVAAAAYRLLHPAVLTEIGLLGAITWLVVTLLGLINASTGDSRTVSIGGISLDKAIAGAIISSVFWIGCALVIGLIGLAEARAGGVAALRRAGIARLWAGVVVVVGVAAAVLQSSSDPQTGEVHRIIEPWVGELIVLGVSAILVERAFRREAGAFVLAAAIGVVIALTDFNFTYFAQAGGTEVALLVEGLLLIGIAIAADRLSKRVGRGAAAPADADLDADPDAESEAVAGQEADAR
jgi:hypothetical protein